jgi:hypothetical protein
MFWNSEYNEFEIILMKTFCKYPKLFKISSFETLFEWWRGGVTYQTSRIRGRSDFWIRVNINASLWKQNHLEAFVFLNQNTPPFFEWFQINRF